MERFVETLQTVKEEFPEFTEAVRLAHENPKPYHYSNEVNMIYSVVLGRTAQAYKKAYDIDGRTVRDCTMGILGLYEVVEAFGYTRQDELGYTYYTDEGVDFASDIFEVLNTVKDEFTDEYSFNIESVPAERAAVVGFQPLLKALKVNRPIAEVYNEIDEYTGGHYKRRMGMSTRELGDLANNPNIITNLENRIEDAITSKTGKITAYLPWNWIQAIDVLTTAKLFEASKIYVEDNLKLAEGTAEYKRAVSDIFNKVLEETQPNYGVMQRPEVQKSTNMLTRALMPFMTQPLQQAGILYDSVGNLIANG